MVTNLVGNTSAGITASANRFAGLYGSGLTLNTIATGINGEEVMPVGGTFQNLAVAYDTTAGGGFSRTFAVYINGADSAITLTINDGSVSGTDTTHTATFAAGDKVSIRTSATGATANTGTVRWTLGASCAANVSMLMGGPAAALSNSLTTYSAVQSFDSNTTAGTSSEQLIPTAGTIKNAYVVLASSPGTGTSYTATLVKNGTPTSLVVAITDTNATGNDLNAGHAVSVTTGDKVYWSIVPTGTPGARVAFLSVEFDPTIDGESVHLFGGASTMVNTLFRYQGIASTNAAFNATETARSGLTQAATWKKLYIYVPTATGAGRTWQFQTDIATVAGNPSVIIDNSSTTGNDTSNTASSNFSDTISMKVTPSGTPAASLVEWGIVSYTAPTGGSSVKTINGVAKSSVKTVNGLAIASVKTWDGLA